MENKVVIGVGLDTKSFDKQIEEVEYQLKQLDYELSHAKELKLDSRTIQEYELKAEKLTNQLASLRKKQEDLNATNLSGISAHLDNIGGGVEKVIKKVTRLGLALFGIRSMYSFIRSSMSTLSGYNDQLATDVEYIRFVLASTLQPVIERIIQLVYTLLQYIGYIAKAWFGVNIFANASAKAFQKGNKQAKQMQKTLAGFDEMNVLSDSSGGDSGSGTAPSMDLSKIKEPNFGKISGWLDKLRKMFSKTFDDILNNVTKVMRDLGFNEDFIEAFEFTILGLKKIIGGFYDFVVGIIKIIVGLVTGNSELAKEGVKQAIGGIANIIKGLVQTVVGVFAMISTIIAAFIKGMINSFGGAIGNIKSFFNTLPNFFSGIVNKITGFFRNLGYSAGNVIAGAFRSVVNGVLRTIENVLNTPIRTINSLISTINKISPVKIGRLSTFSLPRLAKGGIVNMPGRGINYGGANIGEKAPEAVIPFTDEQVMDRLGQSIARHMVINATITNTMNGRVISREIQRVQNNSNFALNR